MNLTVSGYANVYYSAAALGRLAELVGVVLRLDRPVELHHRRQAAAGDDAHGPVGPAVRSELVVDPAARGADGRRVGRCCSSPSVRRTFGGAASIIAGLVMALTPAAVLIFRYNNPDALLTLLLVGAAWRVDARASRAAGFDGSSSPAVLVGLGFKTKFLQAYLVLPAFAITFARRGSGLDPPPAGGGLRWRLPAVLVSSALVGRGGRAHPGGVTAVHRRKHEQLGSRPRPRL